MLIRGFLLQGYIGLDKRIDNNIKQCYLKYNHAFSNVPFWYYY